MRTIPYWIQRADFVATEYGGVDFVRAFEILKTHDWQQERRLLKEREEAAGLEMCPPGVGFTAAPGRILHICPGEIGAALVHYHFPEPRRRLGFIRSTAPTVRSNPAVPVSDLAEFLRRFYDDDHVWLVERTTAA
jgi:hypothetical protein